jgi:hypothetical protein
MASSSAARVMSSGSCSRSRGRQPFARQRRTDLWETARPDWRIFRTTRRVLALGIASQTCRASAGVRAASWRIPVVTEICGVVAFRAWRFPAHVGWLGSSAKLAEPAEAGSQPAVGDSSESRLPWRPTIPLLAALKLGQLPGSLRQAPPGGRWRSAGRQPCCRSDGFVARVSARP